MNTKEHMPRAMRMVDTRYWRCFIGFLAQVNPPFGLLAVVFLGAIVVGTLVAAIILRAAVAFANKFVGGGETGRQYAETIESVRTPDPANPYDVSTHSVAGERSPGVDGIPTPSISKAMGIVFVSAIVGFVIQTVAGFVLSSSPPLIIVLVSLVLAAGVNVGVYQVMLPTSTARALLVYVLSFVIVFGVLALIAGVLFAVGMTTL